MAPLQEFGLSALALELLPPLTLTPREATGLLERLTLLADHARSQPEPEESSPELTPKRTRKRR